jgi:hypothetical protein
MLPSSPRRPQISWKHNGLCKKCLETSSSTTQKTKKKSRLVTRQCSNSSALGTCCSRILDREQFAIIWVFVAFLILSCRVPTHQSETRNQHVFLFLLLFLLQTVGLQIMGFTILHALFQDCSPVYEMSLLLRVTWSGDSDKRFFSFSPSVSWARQLHLTF